MKINKLIVIIILVTIGCGQAERSNVCANLMPDSTFALMLKDIYLIEATGDTLNKAGMYKTLLKKYNLSIDSFDTIIACYMFNAELMVKANKQAIFSLADDTVTIRNQTK